MFVLCFQEYGRTYWRMTKPHSVLCHFSVFFSKFVGAFITDSYFLKNVLTVIECHTRFLRIAFEYLFYKYWREKSENLTALVIYDFKLWFGCETTVSFYRLSPCLPTFATYRAKNACTVS